MKSRQDQHQGKLNVYEEALAHRMKYAHQSYYFTTMEICRITKRVSGRDVIRKLQANGVKIGPAKLLRTNDNGSRVYGWRIAK